MSTKPSILIVDDDPKLRKTLSDILQVRGYAPIAVATGKAALDRIAEEVPAVALIDLKLEDMSGLELMGEIKECCPGTECIVLTGYASQESAIEAVNLGAYSYVQKPYDMEQLLVTVRRAVERREAAEALRESEERFRAIFETAQDSIFVKDRTLKYIQVNPAMERLFGLPASKLIGLTDGSLFPEEAASHIREVDSRVLGGEIIEEEHTKPVKGIPHTFHIIKVPMRDSSGEIIGLCGIARDITERKRAQEEIRRRAAQLEALREVGLGLTAELDLDTLLHSIVSRAVELLGGVTGGLDLYLPERDVLEWTAAVGSNMAPFGTVLHRGEGLSGKVLETGEPLIVDDYHRWEGRGAGFEGCSFAAVVGVPVRWGDEFLGVLEVMAEPPRTFSPADADLLSLLATQAAIAIRNARLYEETRGRAERLAVVNHISRAVGTILDLDDLMETVYREVTSVFQADAFFIALYDEEANELDYRFRMDEGVREPRERRPLGTGLTGLVVSEEKPLLVRDFEKEKDHLPEARLWGTMKAPASWLGVPMLIGERLIGVICVQAYRPRAYGEEEELLLSTIADQVAVAIENARLFEQTQQEIAERKRAEEELQQSLEQLRKTFEGTVEALVSTIGIRDPYTATHQRRVAQLACVIADEMGLSEERIQGIRMAGLIHDLGKINIPAEILSKPGTLSDLEYGLIRMHVQAGYDVLKRFDFPWPVAEIVLQHHERMDGSGYPQGLSDDEIMLEARILAVADVVSAMASHRPYRSALGVDKALEEISQNKGVLYDAEVADVCLKLFAEKGFEFE